MAHALFGPEHTGVLDRSQFPDALLIDGSRQLNDDMLVASGKTIDGVDISAFYSVYNTHIASPISHNFVHNILDDADNAVTKDPLTNDLKIYGAGGITVTKTVNGLEISGTGVGGGGPGAVGIKDQVGTAITPDGFGYVTLSGVSPISALAGPSNNVQISINQALISHNFITDVSANDHHAAFIGLFSGATNVDPSASDRITFTGSNGVTITPSAATLTFSLPATLFAISNLAVTDSNFIVGNGSTWVVETGDAARTSLGLGTGNSPTFTGLTLSGAIASRLVGFDGSKALTSVSDLTSWVAGTTNRVTVSDDGDGTITLSAPQDLHTAADPTFSDMTLDTLLLGDVAYPGAYLTVDNDVLGDGTNIATHIDIDVLDDTLTGNSGEYGIFSRVTNALLNPSPYSLSTYGGFFRSINGDAIGGFGSATSMYGSISSVINRAGQVSSRTVSTAYGAFNQVSITDNGIGSVFAGTYSQVYVGGGSLSNAYGFYSEIEQDLTGVITTSYGLYVNYTGTIGTSWGIYLNGDSKNFFTGSLGLGVDPSISGSKLVVSHDTEQFRLQYDASDYTSFTIGVDGAMTVKSYGAAQESDIFLDIQDMVPTQGYFVNLGSLQKKYLTLHAAELWVETLVAQETIATIGGRVLVGPTTTLTRDFDSTEPTKLIYVKHNQMTIGDIVYLESNGKVEFMEILSAYTTVTPGEEYYYSVGVNLDASGENDWLAGDAVFNTGQAGDGFIDLYSIGPVGGGHSYPTDIWGPTIAGSIRNSSTYNDWTEHWAVGNLDGLYGYGTTTYGSAFGKYETNSSWVAMDSTNGIRFMNGAPGTNLAQWDTTGTIRVGRLTAENIQVTSTAINFRDGTTVYGSLSSTQWVMGVSSTENIQITPTALNFRDGSVVYASLSATEWVIGRLTTENVQITSTAMNFRDATTVYGSLSGTVWTLGSTSTEHVRITSTAVELKTDSSSVYTKLESGKLTLGEVANSRTRIEISDSTGLKLIGRSAAGADTEAITMDFDGNATFTGTITASNISIDDGYINQISGSNYHFLVNNLAANMGDWVAIDYRPQFVVAFSDSFNWGDTGPGGNGFTIDTGDIGIGDPHAAHILWDKSAGVLQFRKSTTVTGSVGTDGTLRFGSNVASATNTSISIFASAQTYNSESVGAGDLLIGDNSSGKANILWDNSAGQLLFRSGTATKLYLDTAGSLNASGGNLKMDDNGLRITTTTAYGQTRAVTFLEPGGGDLGEVGGYSSGTTNSMRVLSRGNSISSVSILGLGDVDGRVYISGQGSISSAYLDVYGTNSNTTAELSMGFYIWSILTTNVGGMSDNPATDAATDSIAIKLNGVTRYIPVYT